MSTADEVINGYAERSDVLIFGAVADEASTLWHDFSFNNEHEIPSPEYRGGLSFVLDTRSGELLVNKGNGEFHYNECGHDFIIFSQGYLSFKSKGDAYLDIDGVKYALYKNRGLNIFIYSTESDCLVDVFSIDLFCDRRFKIHRSISLSTLFLFQRIPDPEKKEYILSLKDGDDYEKEVAFRLCNDYQSRYPMLRPILMKLLWNGVGTEKDRSEALHIHQSFEVPKDFRNLNLKYSVKDEVYSLRKIVVWANEESELTRLLSVCIQYGLHYCGFTSSDESLKHLDVPAEWISPGEIDQSSVVIYAGRIPSERLSISYSVDPGSDDSIFEINDRYARDKEHVLCESVKDEKYNLASGGYIYYDTLKDNENGQILGKTKLKSLKDLSESYRHGKKLVEYLKTTGDRYIMQCWGGMGDEYRILGRLNSYNEVHGITIHPLVTPKSKDFLNLFRYDGMVIEGADKNGLMMYVRISQNYDIPLELVLNDKHFDSIVTGKECSFDFYCASDLFSANLGIPPKTPFDRYHIPRAERELSEKVRGSILLVPHALFLRNAYETERFQALLEKIVGFFSEKGFKLYTNVVGNQRPISGTLPLTTSVSELVSVAHLFSHVITVSTGLADVLINTAASISLLSISHPSLFKKDMAMFCHHGNYWGYVLEDDSDEEIIHGICRAIQDQLPVVRDCHCRCGDKPSKES